MKRRMFMLEIRRIQLPQEVLKHSQHFIQSHRSCFMACIIQPYPDATAAIDAVAQRAQMNSLFDSHLSFLYILEMPANDLRMRQ